mmetsp:Transcript_132348/g.382608  ORF Transcript_132348/g.382608 Transcript_132348/m.382608 type:complete len:364 (-) Transcript_132348:148-1239(-)
MLRSASPCVEPNAYGRCAIPARLALEVDVGICDRRPSPALHAGVPSPSAWGAAETTCFGPSAVGETARTTTERGRSCGASAAGRQAAGLCNDDGERVRRSAAAAALGAPALRRTLPARPGLPLTVDRLVSVVKRTGLSSGEGEPSPKGRLLDTIPEAVCTGRTLTSSATIGSRSATFFSSTFHNCAGWANFCARTPSTEVTAETPVSATANTLRYCTGGVLTALAASGARSVPETWRRSGAAMRRKESQRPVSVQASATTVLARASTSSVASSLMAQPGAEAFIGRRGVSPSTSSAIWHNVPRPTWQLRPTAPNCRRLRLWRRACANSNLAALSLRICLNLASHCRRSCSWRLSSASTKSFLR